MNDTRFYSVVEEELKNQKMHEGLWLKSLTESNGNNEAAKVLYVKYRIEQLRKDAKMTLGMENKKKELQRIEYLRKEGERKQF